MDNSRLVFSESMQKILSEYQEGGRALRQALENHEQKYLHDVSKACRAELVRKGYQHPVKFEGCKHSFIIHGPDGMVEIIPITNPTDAYRALIAVNDLPAIQN